MAFFDDLGKRFAQAGQATAQKAKELGDIARINALISEEEKKMSGSIYQIGELYFKLHYLDYESDFEELINSIKKSQKIISESKQQLQMLKGISRCDKCGAEVSIGVSFCSTCGNKINIATNRNICVACGASVAKNMKFCTSCGKPMAVFDASTKTDRITEGEEPSEFKICSSCGKKMPCEEVFCTECGNKL